MLIPNTSVVPPGGFHYTETHDGISIKIESDSVEATAEALLRYRVNNGIPPGDPQKDVFDYICKNWPHFCHNTDPYNKTVGREQSPDENLSRRMTVWMTKLWNSGPDNSVTQAEAERRAAICAVCPQNQDYRPGGCGGCIDGIERLGFTWRRNRTTTLDAKLSGCKATGAHLPSLVQAEKIPAMSDEEKNRLDTTCWRK